MKYCWHNLLKMERSILKYVIHDSKCTKYNSRLEMSIRNWQIIIEIHYLTPIIQFKMSELSNCVLTMRYFSIIMSNSPVWQGLYTPLKWIWNMKEKTNARLFKWSLLLNPLGEKVTIIHRPGRFHTNVDSHYAIIRIIINGGWRKSLMKGYTLNRAFRKIWKRLCKEGGVDIAIVAIRDDEKENATRHIDGDRQNRDFTPTAEATRTKTTHCWDQGIFCNIVTKDRDKCRRDWRRRVAEDRGASVILHRVTGIIIMGTRDDALVCVIVEWMHDLINGSPSEVKNWRKRTWGRERRVVGGGRTFCNTVTGGETTAAGIRDYGSERTIVEGGMMWLMTHCQRPKGDLGPRDENDVVVEHQGTFCNTVPREK